VGAASADEGGSAHAANGIGEPDFIGGVQVLSGEVGFDDLWVRREQMSTVDAGKQASRNGRRAPLCAVAKEYIVDGGLGDVPVFIDEDNVVETLSARFGVGVIMKNSARGLVVKHRGA
jgi:hypothetical protein